MYSPGLKNKIGTSTSSLSHWKSCLYVSSSNLCSSGGAFPGFLSVTNWIPFRKKDLHLQGAAVRTIEVGSCCGGLYPCPLHLRSELHQPSPRCFSPGFDWTAGSPTCFTLIWNGSKNSARPGPDSAGSLPEEIKAVTPSKKLWV